MRDFDGEYEHENAMNVVSSGVVMSCVNMRARGRGTHAAQ